MKVETQFDATKATKMTTAESLKPPGLDKAEEDKYDPTKVTEMMAFIK